MSNLSALLRSWRSEPTIAGNIEVWHTTPPRPAQLVPLPDDLHPLLANALRAHGVSSLYTHQFTAWQQARARQVRRRGYRYSQWENTLL